MMTRTAFRAMALTTTFCILPTMAMAQEYVTLENSAFPGHRLNASTTTASGAVWMGPTAPPQQQTMSGQQWYAEEAAPDIFKIKLRGAQANTCLTLITHDELRVITAFAPCAVDGAQLWSSSDDDPMRIYNGASPAGECLTAINSGQYTGSLTMTDCGAGDVATELWTDHDAAN